jgi:DNA-directed RNA polymerase specialized sigma subunit
MQIKQISKDEAPRPHRMKAQEARAVIDLWTQQQERSDAPSVNDLAEGLSIPPAEVEDLLRQIRSQQTEAKRTQTIPSGWKVVPLTLERAKTQALWDRIISTVLLCVMTFGITAWTVGTAFTF